MKYCLQCGQIYAESFVDYERETCMGCGFLLLEDTTTTEEQFLQLSEEEKDEYELKIYNLCKASEFFQQKQYEDNHNDPQNWYFTFRFDKYEQFTGEKPRTKENATYYRMKAMASLNRAKQRYTGTTGRKSNAPKCPTCNSTNLRRISTTSKAVNTIAFGVLGTKRYKTFHCNSCGYEW